MRHAQHIVAMAIIVGAAVLIVVLPTSPPRTRESPRPVEQQQPTAPPKPKTEDAGHEARRLAMVRTQLERRDVRDARVLAAMRKVPRHRFVPAELATRAYDDRPYPIGHGQTISQPYIVAFMSEALRLKGGEKVLEIGTGSGYQAAVLGELARLVYTIEIVEPLARGAAEVLKALGYTNIHVRAGDGYRGWPEHAPFDAIMLTAAPGKIPAPLIAQLKEGGVLVAPVGETWDQTLVRLTKREGRLVEEKLLPVRFVPMTGEALDGPADAGK